MFLYLAFIATGTLGGLIGTTQLIPTLQKESGVAQVLEIVKGPGIDIGAVSVFTFLYFRENTSNNVQLSRISRDDNLSNLKLRVDEKKAVSVSTLRGIARQIMFNCQDFFAWWKDYVKLCLETFKFYIMICMN